MAVRFEEQYTLSGVRLTVTSKLHWLDAPQLSPAITVTVVVPTGKRLPLGGKAERKGGGLQPPLAEQVNNTTAPFELVAATVRFEEQVNSKGEPASAGPAGTRQARATTQASVLMLISFRPDRLGVWPGPQHASPDQ